MKIFGLSVFLVVFATKAAMAISFIELSDYMKTSESVGGANMDEALDEAKRRVLPKLETIGVEEAMVDCEITQFNTMYRAEIGMSPREAIAYIKAGKGTPIHTYRCDFFY